MRALSHFAHKYEVSSLKTAIISLVPPKCEASQVEELLQLYQSSPEECSLLQDEILDCILRSNVRVHNIEDNLVSILHPRHLNRWLRHIHKDPAKLLLLIRLIISKVKFAMLILLNMSRMAKTVVGVPCRRKSYRGWWICLYGYLLPTSKKVVIHCMQMV